MDDYYQQHCTTFCKQTVSIDPAVFLDPFVHVLPEGASILDVGCGSGRDLLWAKNRGFMPAGFEKSPGLAAFARKHSGCEVIEGDFETFDFSAMSFDAILASGSLVHVPHARLADIIRNLTQALAPGGWFYTSHKKGDGARTDDTGRVFYLWQDTDLRRLFDTLGFELIHFSSSESVKNSKDMWLGYVLKSVNHEQDLQQGVEQ